MTFLIAVSGKGGTGKTTVTALLVRSLVRAGEVPVLAVDADPNANLHEALGVPLAGTLGSLREEAFRESIPPGMTRSDYIALRFRQSIVESEGFDLVAMGRPEGPGCYCFAHDLLQISIGMLGRDYPFIVVDNEAGMEHLSRGTIGVPDLLLVVSDPGIRGARTAVRIRDLARSLGLSGVPVWLVMNRWNGEAAETLPGLPEVVARVPEDREVEIADIGGKPVGSIPSGSSARVAVEELTARIIPFAREKARRITPG